MRHHLHTPSEHNRLLACTQRKFCGALSASLVVKEDRPDQMSRPVEGGCNNSHRGAAAAHLSPQNVAPNSARRGRSTSAHRMATSGAPPPAPGICTPFPVQSPGAGAVPCTVANLPGGMRTPSPVPQHAFAYKVDRWLSSALGEVASSHRPGESFLIDHQCPLWGGRSALPHVDLPLPASLSSSSVSWGRRCGSSGKEDHSKDSQSFDDQHP